MIGFTTFNESGRRPPTPHFILLYDTCFGILFYHLWGDKFNQLSMHDTK